MPEIFRCPGCAQAASLGVLECPANCANYFAIVGAQTTWPGDTGKKIDDIQDGSTNTLLLVEAIKPICWMEPNDLSYGQALELLTTNKKPGQVSTSGGFFSVSTGSSGLNAIFADAHVAWLQLGMEKEVASALLTCPGQELLEEEMDWHGQTDHHSYHRVRTKIHWSNIYSLSLFLILSLLPILKKTDDLAFRYGRKPLEKIIDRFSRLKVIDECLRRHTSTSENGRPAQQLRRRCDKRFCHEGPQHSERTRLPLLHYMMHTQDKRLPDTASTMHPRSNRSPEEVRPAKNRS
jgi:hypothetical protein